MTHEAVQPTGILRIVEAMFDRSVSGSNLLAGLLAGNGLTPASPIQSQVVGVRVGVGYSSHEAPCCNAIGKHNPVLTLGTMG